MVNFITICVTSIQVHLRIFNTSTNVPTTFCARKFWSYYTSVLRALTSILGIFKFYSSHWFLSGFNTLFWETSKVIMQQQQQEGSGWAKIFNRSASSQKRLGMSSWWCCSWTALGRGYAPTFLTFLLALVNPSLLVKFQWPDGFEKPQKWVRLCRSSSSKAVYRGESQEGCPLNHIMQQQQ